MALYRTSLTITTHHRLPLSDCTELCSNVEVEHDKHPKPGYVKFNLDIECDLREDPSDRLHVRNPFSRQTLREYYRQKLLLLVSTQILAKPSNRAKLAKQQVALPTTKTDPLALLFDKVERDQLSLSYICQYHGTAFRIAFRTPTIDTFVNLRHCRHT
ncbi:hypothetical protein O0I10_007821 [Lichtheimia ornata]|uniref:Uncharacterized protein n=1 Tax=Lichtheimia ornata TaxID=688661 RepID=A0AAD7XXE8_9FUNG|nr:uncharacterized protein O0I10_007821 [Lichtheimia ornata]KAJ8656498.1 hypothetical protein O0I10_007821 [Lichtheimia ornata]